VFIITSLDAREAAPAHLAGYVRGLRAGLALRIDRRAAGYVARRERRSRGHPRDRPR